MLKITRTEEKLNLRNRILRVFPDLGLKTALCKIWGVKWTKWKGHAFSEYLNFTHPYASILFKRKVLLVSFCTKFAPLLASEGFTGRKGQCNFISLLAAKCRQFLNSLKFVLFRIISLIFSFMWRIDIIFLWGLHPRGIFETVVSSKKALILPVK